MMPIGAYDSMSGREVHMNPEEAITAFTDLGAKQMVPMHYGTFPLGGEPMEEPIQRLHAATAGHKLHGKVLVPEEGKPAIF